jgi:hypothetical protein
VKGRKGEGREGGTEEEGKSQKNKRKGFKYLRVRGGEREREKRERQSACFWFA